VSAGEELHHEGIAWAEGDLGLRDGWGGVDVAHAPALGEGGDGEDALHPGEAFADALATATAKGEVGEFRAGGFGFWGEAVGVEAEGIGKVLGVAADDVLAEEEVCAGGDSVGAKLNGCGGHAAHGPGGWIEAHGFGEDLFGVAEGGVVGEGGEALLRAGAEDGVEFGVEFGFDVGVLAEEVPGPGEGVGYGLVAGEKDGEDFVADLLVGHAGVLAGGVGLLVAAAEEHGEEIATVGFAAFCGFAMLVDEAVDGGVEAALGAAKLHDAGDGEVEEGFDFREGDDEVVDAHDGVDFVVDAADVGGDLGVEEGAGDDFEGELHAGGGDVDGLTGLPLLALVDGTGYDLVSVGGDALAVEGGGRNATLTHVDGIVGGDEAFAEEDLHATDGALFDEGRGLIDEDLADVFGVVDEDDGCAHEAVVGDVAVGLQEMFEEEDGTA
jgi:hypothetical protein